MKRSSTQEILVGLVVLACLGGMISLVAMAVGGPGFLSNRRTIDVVFKDGQGVRIGSAVQIAGLTSGRVEGVDLVQDNGVLKARVRITIPESLAEMLKQDVKIAIKATLTGQTMVNIISSGASTLELVPGQVVVGTETSFFDPIMEQIGLGPGERHNISHMIGEVRKTMDTVLPQVAASMASLESTAGTLKETTNVVRPNVEQTIAQLQQSVERLQQVFPKVDASLAKVDHFVTTADTLLSESGPDVREAVAGARGLLLNADQLMAEQRPNIAKTVAGLENTRIRADRVLYQAELLTTQGVDVMNKSKANIERTASNVRDATDWGDKLVQKIYSNPFYLSPFYKPTAQDLQAHAYFDSAQAVIVGAKELHDTVKTLETLRASARTQEEAAAVDQLYAKAAGMSEKLNQTMSRMADGLQPASMPAQGRQGLRR
jgi:phospholipid/cholesterol/gamma-HCH transport system substrate-binding protein